MLPSRRLSLVALKVRALGTMFHLSKESRLSHKAPILRKEANFMNLNTSDTLRQARDMVYTKHRYSKRNRGYLTKFLILLSIMALFLRVVWAIYHHYVNG